MSAHALLNIGVAVFDIVHENSPLVIPFIQVLVQPLLSSFDLVVIIFAKCHCWNAPLVQRILKVHSYFFSRDLPLIVKLMHIWDLFITSRRKPNDPVSFKISNNLRGQQKWHLPYAHRSTLLVPIFSSLVQAHIVFILIAIKLWRAEVKVEIVRGLSRVIREHLHWGLWLRLLEHARGICTPRCLVDQKSMLVACVKYDAHLSIIGTYVKIPVVVMITAYF